MRSDNDNLLCRCRRVLAGVRYYWLREYRHVLRDAEVLVFFLLLPIAYPILYALIYNPEVVTDIPVVVVDDARTALSREIVGCFDATPAAHIVGYCANLDEARSMMMQRECYAIILFPSSFSRDIDRGEQSSIVFYTDMSLLLNYKELYMALNNVVLDIESTIRLQQMPIGLSSSITDIVANPIPYTSVVLYNPTSGIASFLIPAVLVLILQQSVVLGIAMLAGKAHEQGRGWFERRNYWTQLVGRMLCYSSIYLFNTIYLLHFIPSIFGYPQLGTLSDIMIFSLPFILSSICMAVTLSVMVREREQVYLLFVAMSVILLFLSGIAWPRYAMPAVWRWLSYIFPSTWGVEGFVQLSTMGACFSDVAQSYCHLWVLVIFYMITARVAVHYDNRAMR